MNGEHAGAPMRVLYLSWRDRDNPEAGGAETFTDRTGEVMVAHGEREAMKAARKELLDVRGLERSQVSLSGYWAAGRAEETFQAEKKLPVGKIL